MYWNTKNMKKFVIRLVRFVARIWADENFKINKLKESKRYMEKLRDIHQGKRCYIIGNGPSLTLEDLNKLKNEFTFASNKIFLLYQKTNWRPTYYCVEDDLVFEQNQSKIKNIKGSVKLFPRYAYDFFGDAEDVHYFNQLVIGSFKNPLANPEFPGFSEDAADKVYWGSTIVYTQIQLAAHMGFEEIYLLGVDFSYVLPEKKVSNYYISDGEKNHFIEKYREPGEKWNKPNLDVHTRSFMQALTSLESKGVKIFNSTRGGKLEIFQRQDLDHVLKNPLIK